MPHPANPNICPNNPQGKGHHYILDEGYAGTGKCMFCDKEHPRPEWGGGKTNDSQIPLSSRKRLSPEAEEVLSSGEVCFLSMMHRKKRVAGMGLAATL